MNEDNKKKQKKIPLCPKNVVHFGCFTDEKKCEIGKQGFSNKVIVFNAANVLTFQYKNARTTIFKKYYSNWSISIATKANLRGIAPI